MRGEWDFFSHTEMEMNDTLLLCTMFLTYILLLFSSQEKSVCN